MKTIREIGKGRNKYVPYPNLCVFILEKWKHLTYSFIFVKIKNIYTLTKTKMVKLVEEDRVRTYTLAELEKMEWKCYRTLKKQKEHYIPLMIFDAWAKAQYRAWIKSTPYSVKYVRLKDIKEYVKKNSWKILTFN